MNCKSICSSILLVSFLSGCQHFGFSKADQSSLDSVSTDSTTGAKEPEFYRYHRFSSPDSVVVSDSIPRFSFRNKSLESQAVLSQSLSRLPEQQAWLLRLKDRFTIQYTSSNDLRATKRLAEDLAKTLPTPRIFKVRHNNQDFYTILAGGYSSFSKAEAVASGYGGWVRKVKKVRSNLCRNIGSNTNGVWVLNQRFCEE